MKSVVWAQMSRSGSSHTHSQSLVLQLECVRCSINHEGIGLGWEYSTGAKVNRREPAGRDIPFYAACYTSPLVPHRQCRNRCYTSPAPALGSAAIGSHAHAPHRAPPVACRDPHLDPHAKPRSFVWWVSCREWYILRKAPSHFLRLPATCRLIPYLNSNSSKLQI